MLTDEKRAALRKAAERAKYYETDARIADPDGAMSAGAAFRGLLTPDVVLSLLNEPLTPNEAGAIQAVSEVEALRRESARLREAIHWARQRLMDADMFPGIREHLLGALSSSVPSEPVFTAAQVREVLERASASCVTVNGQAAVLNAANALGVTLRGALNLLAPDSTPR
jgi:hypothetical protein